MTVSKSKDHRMKQEFELILRRQFRFPGVILEVLIERFRLLTILHWRGCDCKDSRYNRILR